MNRVIACPGCDLAKAENEGERGATYKIASHIQKGGCDSLDSMSYPEARAKVEQYNETDETGPENGSDGGSGETGENPEGPATPDANPGGRGPENGENPLLKVPMPDGGVSDCPECGEETIGIDSGKTVEGEIYENDTYKGKGQATTEPGDEWCPDCEILVYDGGYIK
jgi:hypothetical protein